jgi:hypothetical protein
LSETSKNGVHGTASAERMPVSTTNAIGKSMIAKDARINEKEKQVAQVLGIGIYAYSDQRARRRIDSEYTSTYTQRRPH